MGSPTAGVCPDELFDVTPYLAAYVRFGVRHPLTQDFPRKFKTSFTGCVEHDAVASSIHDFSFIAEVRGENGTLRRGFKVLVGGGTSIMPRLGKVLYEFVPVEDYLRVAQAVWAVFNRADFLRKNRMMARIKVLIDKIGIDAFRAQVDEELQTIGPIDPTPLMDVNEIYHEVPPQSPAASSSPGHELPEVFPYWKRTNAVEQKQPGYYMVYVKIPLGDVYAHQWPALADIVHIHRRASPDDPGAKSGPALVPEAYLYDVWKALGDIGFAEPEAHGITDVVACPGTDSCKLGITSSMGLGRAIREALASWNGLLEDPLIAKLHVKMSGCPNGCAHGNACFNGWVKRNGRSWSAVSERGTARRRGIVYLVGAGPGDPGLITVKGLQVLRTADVVVYDRLVHPALLGEAPSGSERIYVSKRAGMGSLRKRSIPF